MLMKHNIIQLFQFKDNNVGTELLYWSKQIT